MLKWTEFNARRAVGCTLPILLLLVWGLWAGHPAAGLVAAGGALSVGFGSFQQFTHYRRAPMLLGCAGIALSAFIGSLAGGHPVLYTMCAGLWALLPGFSIRLGAGAWWIAVQWAIALLVGGAYPSGLEGAGERAAALLAGGGLQVALSAWSWARPGDPEVTQAETRQLWGTFTAGFSSASGWIFPVRSAFTLMVATWGYQLWHVPNGYWIPMTAIITMKPEFHETLTRGLARSAGTLLGAGVATLIAATLRPSPELLVVLVTTFAWLSYAFLKVNYAIFAVFLTAYIVFLIGLANLPELQVVWHRLIATAIGGALAIAAHALPAWKGKAA